MTPRVRSGGMTCYPARRIGLMNHAILGLGLALSACLAASAQSSPCFTVSGEKASVHNVFKDANIANIHTHGLHISGESPGDDVTRAFEGGFGGDFVYDIPADHMGGTFWYSTLSLWLPR